MKRHELWRQQYRARRYLEHLNMEELAQRMRDLTCNMTILTNDGKLGPRPIEDGGSYWIELFTHGLEEYGLRNEDFTPGLMEKTVLPKPTWPERPKSAEVIQGRKLEPDKYIVKYGKSDYLKKGLLRISPASKYNDPSLNPTIRDDELKKSIYGLPSEVKLELLDKKTGMPKQRIEPIGNVKLTKESITDYFVYCVSCVYDLRLFDDFEADCCLIIHNPSEFTKRLNVAFFQRIPTRIAYQRKVNYIDPLNGKADDLDVYSSKHFRYAYQNEYRFIWIPLDTQKVLEPVDLEINGLTEVAELIRLDG